MIAKIYFKNKTQFSFFLQSLLWGVRCPLSPLLGAPLDHSTNKPLRTSIVEEVTFRVKIDPVSAPQLTVSSPI